MFKFGGVDKKEFKMLKDFMLAKENFFKIRNFAPDAEEEDEDDDDDEDEEDEDFNSDVASVRMSIANVLSRVIRYHKIFVFNIHACCIRSDDNGSNKISGEELHGQRRLRPRTERRRRIFEPAGEGFEEPNEEEGEERGGKKVPSAPMLPERRNAAYKSPSSSFCLCAPCRSQASPKKKSAKKDPNAPKRGMSAFMLWSNFMRPQIKAEQPDLKLTDISKVLGEKWKAVTDEVKQEFQGKADADKARYLEEMKTYVPPDVDSDDAGGGATKKKRKAQKDPNAPKKPMTSYFLFMAQVSNE